MNLGYIRLVLLGGVRAEADRVAKIIGTQTGHHGIQINDAHAVTRFRVHQNVVQLRIVMRHAQGQFPRRQHIHQRPRLLGTRQRKLDLRLHALRTSRTILPNRLTQRLYPAHRVMEVRNGLMQRLGGIIRQHHLEFAEGLTCLAENIRILRQLIGAGIGYVQINAPAVAVRVHEPVTILPRGEQRQRLAVRVAMRRKNSLPQKARHAAHVLHDLHRPGKARGRNPLQNIVRRLLCLHQKRIVDMTAAIRTNRLDLSLRTEMSKNFLQLRLRRLMHRYSLQVDLWTIVPIITYCCGLGNVFAGDSRRFDTKRSVFQNLRAHDGVQTLHA